MKKILLTAMVMAGAFGFAIEARAAACGPVSTADFTSVVTSIQTTPVPCSGKKQCKQTKNKIKSSAKSTQKSINSSCNVMNSMSLSSGPTSLATLGNFTNMFTGQLGQITNLLNQAKSLQSQAASVTNVAQKTALMGQVQQMVNQAKTMADQVLQQARQAAKQIAESLEVNL